MPARARAGDAGIDLLARSGVTLEPGGGRALVPTGLALNAPGLIDPGYRGEVGVILVNTDPTERYEVHRGDRVAQLLLVSFETATFVSAAALEESERGEGGFGHTGR
jgi:dUTP pyrophosphatase